MLFPPFEEANPAEGLASFFESSGGIIRCAVVQLHDHDPYRREGTMLLNHRRAVQLRDRDRIAAKLRFQYDQSCTVEE